MSAPNHEERLQIPDTLECVHSGLYALCHLKTEGTCNLLAASAIRHDGKLLNFFEKRNSPVTMNFGKSAVVSMIALAMAFALGCSAQSDKDSSAAATASAPSAETFDPSNPERVDEAIMAQIIPGIEAAFSDRNATGRWEGTVMHVKMTGDASSKMSGFSECRVLVQLLKEGQTAVVEFPNGTLQCTEVLKED